MKKLLVVLLFITMLTPAMAQRLICDPYLTNIHIGTYYMYAIPLNPGQIVTFHTNLVCNATGYLWTFGNGGGSVTTTTPDLTVNSRDFLWLPPGGCDDFNANLTPDGVYHTSLTVTAIGFNTVTVLVDVSGVSECEDGTLGEDEEEFEDPE